MLPLGDVVNRRANIAVETGALQQPGYSYSMWHRLFEVCGILAAYTLLVCLLWRVLAVVVATYTAEETARGHWLVATVCAAWLLGYLVADFTSGMIHWAFDRYGTVDTPLIGAHFVGPFRNHHIDPRDITRHDFIETNGNNCLFTLLPLSFFMFLPLDFGNAAVLFLAAMAAFLALFAFATNQLHKWAHCQQPPAIVARLQQLHLILPRAHHQIHHTFPYQSHYCITTGWMNGLLVKIGWWHALEVVVDKLLGVRAHRDAAPVARYAETSQ